MIDKREGHLVLPDPVVAAEADAEADAADSGDLAPTGPNTPELRMPRGPKYLT